MGRRGRSGTRKNKSLSIARRLYSPFSHLFEATGESVGNVARGVGNVGKRVIKTADNVGRSYARHTNEAISNLTRGRKGRGRKSRRRHSRR